MNKATMNHIQHQTVLLRINTFCAALEIKEATARKWLQERRIASVKVGSRAVRIPRSEVGRIIRRGFAQLEFALNRESPIANPEKVPKSENGMGSQNGLRGDAVHRRHIFLYFFISLLAAGDGGRGGPPN